MFLIVPDKAIQELLIIWFLPKNILFSRDIFSPIAVNTNDLFFDVGAEILKNIGGYLAASPDKATQKIRKDVINAIKTVKSGGDIKKIQTLKLQLDKLNKIGGLKAIVPSEGIVFKYKGKTYKFTGAFAPVNQILGLLNF